MVPQLTIDTTIRCPQCQSFCQLIRKNVYYKKQRGGVLYRCSDEGCDTYMLVKGIFIILLNNKLRQQIAKENYDLVNRTFVSKLNHLEAKKSKTERELKEINSQIDALQEQLSQSGTFWLEFGGTS